MLDMQLRRGELMTAFAIATFESRTRSLANKVWVSKEFEFSRRRENLSWSHHRQDGAGR